MKEFNSYQDISENFTGICKVINSGAIYHMKDGKAHRENGPAIVNKNGSKFWCINGLEHREDGPAVEYSDGIKQWWYKDICYGHNYDDFTIESWKEKVEQLKREEELKIFK